ncbi:MAG TPA: MFS transporter [Actinomycetaceae bacterium]|nr:MFS transporter [Actinomycetaceae bacterium]
MRAPRPSGDDTSAHRRNSTRRAAAWGIFAVVLAGLNLRPGIVAVAPLVSDIRTDLGIGAGPVGMLTAIPLACFALVSPFVPLASRRWGVERVIAVSLAVLAGALAARALPSVPALLLATLVVGISTAVGNVLVPTAVKQWFPDRLGTATGLYSVALFTGAALAGALTTPIAQLMPGGWRASLGSWALLAALALPVWWVTAARSAQPVATGTWPATSVWRQPVAWSVTGYMGLQSFHYFTVAAWLPEMLISAGHSPAAAGVVLGVCNGVAMLAALLVPVVAARRTGQGVVGVALAAASAAGLGAVLLLPGAPAVTAILLGVGQGGAIGLALLLVVLRGGSPTHTAALSGMSQSAGYLLAATGAPLLGVIHDATGTWSWSVAVLLGCLAAQACSAWAAGRPRTLTASPICSGKALS